MNALMMLVSLSALAARGIRIAIPREEYLAAVGLLLTYLREQRGMQVRRVTFCMLADQALVNACVESLFYRGIGNVPANLRSEVACEVNGYESGRRLRNRYSHEMDYFCRFSCCTHSDRRGMRINREQRQDRRDRQRERERLMRSITIYKDLVGQESLFEALFDDVQA